MNFSQLLDAVHISTLNCDEMARDSPRQPAHKISTLNVDFSSLSPDPLGSRRPAQAGVKYGYLSKSGYFAAISSCSVKTVVDKHKHAACCNKQ